MAFEDEIRRLADSVSLLRERVATEEATKHALVLPLVQSLGFNVFDPHEVEPEYNADFGETKGWKADYTLKASDQPVIIVECKSVSNNLSGVVPQLGRYFPHTKARIGVLTNGILYRFFTDQNETNIMDEEPFWEFSLESFSDRDLEQLEKFTKGTDVTDAVTAASRLKYIVGMKETLSKQYHNQADDKANDAFAEWLARPLLPSRSRMTDEIKEMARLALHEFVEDLVLGRLRGNQQPAPVSDEAASVPEVDEPVEELADESNAEDTEQKALIVTTDEELEGYEIVKAVVGEVVDGERVTIRDAQQYCAVLLDDNNRRPLCRLHFNRSQKYIGLFDGSRTTSGTQTEMRYPIETLQDIHNYAEQIRETARRYLES